MVSQKGLLTRNTHVKYENCISNHLKVMANVKVFSTTRQPNGQTDTLTKGQTNQAKPVLPNL